MNNRITIAAIFLAFALSSCVSTEMLQQGKTKFYQGKAPANLVVIAYPGQLMDIKAFEGAMVKRLKSKKTKVTSAYDVFRNETNIPEDANSIRNALKEKGFDGMVEIKLVSIRKVATTSEYDYPTRREYRIMDVANYSKLIQEYDKREEKGATFEDVKVKMDVRVVDLTQEEAQVIWSARTETTEPKTAKNVANGMTKKAVKSLKKDDIL